MIEKTSSALIEDPGSPFKSKTFRRPRIALIIAGILLLPEILLQLISFFLWYYDRQDSSPRVLCVADYNAKYPAGLRKALNEWKTSWKVVDESNPDLNLDEVIGLIDFYAKRQKPVVVYLSIGFNDIRHPDDKKRMTHVWNDSFEWKCRSCILFQEALTGRIPSSQLFASSLMRPISKKIETSSTKVFEKIPIDRLISIPIPEDSKPLIPGKYDLVGVELNFFGDGRLTFGERQMEWTMNGKRLIITAENNRVFEFIYEHTGQDILLHHQLSPISFVLKVKDNNKASTPSNFFSQLTRAWGMFLSRKMETAEEHFVRLDQFDDPTVSAALARIYLETHQPDKRNVEIQKLKKKYKNSPDERTAEALFYAMKGSPVEEIASVAKELLERYPFDFNLWIFLQDYSEEAGDYEFADKVNYRAAELRRDVIDGQEDLKTKRFLGLRVSPGANHTEFQSVVVRSKPINKLRSFLMKSDGLGLTVVLVPYPIVNAANRLMWSASPSSFLRGFKENVKPENADELLEAMVKQDLKIRIKFSKTLENRP